MRNVGEPKQYSQALLATVVNSVLLYCSSLWGARAHNSAVMQNMHILEKWLRYSYSLRIEPTCGRGSNERMRQTPYWT